MEMQSVLLLMEPDWLGPRSNKGGDAAQDLLVAGSLYCLPMVTSVPFALSLMKSSLPDVLQVEFLLFSAALLIPL